MNKKQMLERVGNYLSLFGKVDKRILKAIDKIDRKYFVNNYEGVYFDSPLPIGNEQTISQPSTVARMLSLLELKKRDNVLEIGVGSGWNACLIAYIVKPGKVLGLERHEKLIEFAKKNVKRAKIRNLEIQNKDFRKINKKFDKIIFTAGIKLDQKEVILEFAKTNLKSNGRLICPFKLGSILIIDKLKGKISRKHTSEEYSFVPLVLE